MQDVCECMALYGEDGELRINGRQQSSLEKMKNEALMIKYMEGYIKS